MQITSKLFQNHTDSELPSSLFYPQFLLCLLALFLYTKKEKEKKKKIQSPKNNNVSINEFSCASPLSADHLERF